MQSSTDPEVIWHELFNQYHLAGLLAAASTDGWQTVWSRFDELYQSHSFKSNIEKNVSMDLFMSYCLSYMPADNAQLLWELMAKWHTCRKLPECYPALSPDELTASTYFCLRLRKKLRDFLLQSSLESLSALPEAFWQLMLEIWPQLFLNMMSPLQLINAGDADSRVSPENCKALGYPGLLAASMYYPADADLFNIDSQGLFASALPLYCKTIIMRWMVHIPYFSATIKHHDRLMRYIPELCRTLTRRTDIVTEAYFLNFVQEAMTGFWRASYIGGNNVEALSVFGDFISATIQRFCPQLPEPVLRTRQPGEKVRVGYISRNFFQQAVSYYMMNRIIHHDRNHFEVFVFSLGEHQDSFTDIYSKHSDHFKKFPDLQKISEIIKSVLDSQLDILIFTDIGMDVVTYILAGLRMAPLQCAMVGHGTTTGLPTIDYYISGDFESPGAQAQYREKLMCLPKLGAAQYLPDSPVLAVSRASLGIPDDAVVFVSCANGIKHRPEREIIYIEILKQAPRAWIVIKPYTTQNGIDVKMAKRLKSLAAAAAVADRLLILPSFSDHRNVLGLLAIADVQLDTYPYGGWTTNLEALYMGLPVVTQEGELSRSRWGAGMLRALGVTAGIAANEEEFIGWAVRLARDQELRQQAAAMIKANAVQVLFSGAAAQPAFENMLRELLRLGPRTAPAVVTPSTAGDPGGQPLADPGRAAVNPPDRLYVVTSIAPRNYEAQQAALATWLSAGFKIISLNAAEEIELLQPAFPDVEFQAARRDARQQFQHPYVYFDDLLACLRQTPAKAGGVINSDIYLLQPGLRELVSRQDEMTTLFGSRLDVAKAGARAGKLYDLGFDYFFFGRDLLEKFPPESFCLGLPWWDYWAALIPLLNRWPVKRLITPVAAHVCHQTAWDQECWHKLGTALAVYFPPAFELSPEKMPYYLHILAHKINRQSTDILL